VIGLHASSPAADEQSATPSGPPGERPSCGSTCASGTTTSPRSSRPPAGAAVGAAHHRPLSQRGILDIAPARLHLLLTTLPARTRSADRPEEPAASLACTSGSARHDPARRRAGRRSATSCSHDPSDYALCASGRAKYFAAALLMPEKSPSSSCARPLADGRWRSTTSGTVRRVLRDGPRTVHATWRPHHFGIPVHFTRVHENGIVYKAYENDGVRFPADVTGAIEGQPSAAGGRPARSSARRPVFVVLPVHRHVRGHILVHGPHRVDPLRRVLVTVGTPFEHARWFRAATPPGVRCPAAPTPTVAGAPPPTWSAAGRAAPGRAARVHSHLLAALPPGTFPGVDAQDVYEFLERRA